MVSGKFQPTRRAVLLLGFSVPVLGLSGSPSADTAAAPSDDEAGLSRFLAFSRFATDRDRLDPDVGRLLWFNLNRGQADFSAHFDALDRKRSTLGSPDVEDLAARVTGGPLHSILMEIVRGWYTGSVRHDAAVEVFAFETALMYESTRDRVVIPTFAHDGPNYWAKVLNSNGVLLQPRDEGASTLRKEGSK